MNTENKYAEKSLQLTTLKKTLFKDILLGLVLAGISATISLLSLVVMKGRTDLAFELSLRFLLF